MAHRSHEIFLTVSVGTVGDRSRLMAGPSADDLSVACERRQCFFVIGFFVIGSFVMDGSALGATA
ncbi:MAG: hypothetical protein ACRDN9_09815 [Streptosporangiaceae bacterium]